MTCRSSTASPMRRDRARDCRRDQATRHRHPDFKPPRGAPVKQGDLKPHQIRYWLTPPTDDQFDTKVTDICRVYRDAPALTAQGERVVSTDELSGVQALERKHPNLPLRPGKVERREH